MDILSIIVQTATLIAIVFAAWQLLFHSRQMHREFEHLYVARYWVLMDKRSVDFVVDGKVSGDERLIVLGYLQLCEDEIDLRRLGRITDNTWEFWSGATLDQVANPIYANELAGVGDDYFPRLRTLIKTDGEDPLKRTWIWRKFHGL